MENETIETAASPAVVEVSTFKQFRKLSFNKKDNDNVVGCAIAMYVIAAISLIVLGFLYGDFLSIIDFVVIVVLALFLQLGANRGCAIALLLYNIGNFILKVMAGTTSGMAFVLIFVCGQAMISSFKLHSKWKKFKKGEDVKGYSIKF